MKWSDNEEAQNEYEEAVKTHPIRQKLYKEAMEEMQMEVIKEKEEAMRKIWKEDAKLRKKDRNKLDYMKRPEYTQKRNRKLDILSNEIYYLEIAMKTRFRQTYRTSTPACFAINKPFKGSVKHHIDKDTIVHIPESLHFLVSHNLKTGKGMEEINVNVFRWLRQQS